MTRFAVSIPQICADGEFDSDALVAYLNRVEQLGFHSAWVQENILGVTPVLDPLATLGYAVAKTDHLRLGCAVFVTSLRNPILLAKSLASLDQISGGRIEVGVAAGGPWAATSAFGIDADTRVARFSEGLQIMKACWTEPTINLAGKFWKVEGVAMEPKPFQKPHPPLWIGGSAPRALLRAVREADGFFGGGLSTTADFAQQVSTIRKSLTEMGRDRTRFQIAKRVYVAIDDDVESARSRIDYGLQQLYGTTGLADVSVFGTPADCVKGLQEVIEAGAELVQMNPILDEARQIERLAAEVIPHLR